MSPVADLSVEIVSRYGGQAWAGRAQQVSVPLVDGEIGVLPGRQFFCFVIYYG